MNERTLGENSSRANEPVPGGPLPPECLAKNARYTQEYLNDLAELGGDEAGRRGAWERMWGKTAFYRGLPVAFSYVPRFFGLQTRHEFERLAAMTYGILAKIIRRYRADAEYRREFRFDPRVEELVLLPQGYDEPLPITRIDFALDEETGDFRFVEFNTDSSSGMNENREALSSLLESEPLRRFAARHALEHDIERHFDGWVSTFARLWESSERKVERPHLGILVCLDSPTPDARELEAYMPLFERAGFTCSVFDVRNLRFDGQRLWGTQALAGPGNVAIDCIWRFCIVVDLLENWERVQPLVEALRAEKVEMIGSFATQIVHDKQLFAVMRRPKTLEMLTDEERAFVEAHIPATFFLDDAALDLEEVKAHPQRWVIKPTDWYASINVAAGPDFTQGEWARLVDERVAQAGVQATAGESAGAQAGAQAASPFIAQEFFAPYATPTVPIYGNEEDFTAAPQSFGNLLGLYVHAGRFGGAYMRQGPYQAIGSARAGLVTPIFWVLE